MYMFLLFALLDFGPLSVDTTSDNLLDAVCKCIAFLAFDFAGCTRLDHFVTFGGNYVLKSTVRLVKAHLHTTQIRNVYL